MSLKSHQFFSRWKFVTIFYQVTKYLSSFAHRLHATTTLRTLCHHHWPMQPLPLRCRAPLPKVFIFYFIFSNCSCSVTKILVASLTTNLCQCFFVCQSTIILLPKFGDLSILVTTYHRFFTELSLRNSLTNTHWSRNFHLLSQKFWWQKVVFLLVF